MNDHDRYYLALQRRTGHASGLPTHAESRRDLEQAAHWAHGGPALRTGPLG